MLRRILAIVAIAAGLVCAGLAVASATVWKPADHLTARATVPADTPVVVTDPGVLDQVADTVTIQVRAAGDVPVVVAIGTATDVQAWVDGARHARLIGVDQDGAMGVRVIDGDPSTPSAEDSDLWLEQVSGTGAVDLKWTDRPGSWCLLVSSDGRSTAAATVDLTWPRTVSTPLLVPGLVLGAALFLLGVVLLVWSIVRAGRRSPRSGAGRTGRATSAPDRAPTGLPQGGVPTPAEGTHASTPGGEGAAVPGGPSGPGDVTLPPGSEAPVIPRRNRDRRGRGTRPAPGSEAPAAPAPEPVGAAAPAPGLPEVPGGDRPGGPPTQHLTRRQIREARGDTGETPVVPSGPDRPAPPAAGGEADETTVPKDRDPAAKARGRRRHTWRETGPDRDLTADERPLSGALGEADTGPIPQVALPGTPPAPRPQSPTADRWRAAWQVPQMEDTQPPGPFTRPTDDTGDAR